MDEKVIEEILNDLYSAFEDADTQSTAIMLFMKDQGIATEETLAPYLDQAGKASDVKWRAARARMTSLLKSAMKPSEPESNKKPDIPQSQVQDPKETAQRDGASGRQRKERSASQSADKQEQSRSHGDSGNLNNETSREALTENNLDARGSSNLGEEKGG